MRYANRADGNPRHEPPVRTPSGESALPGAYSACCVSQRHTAASCMPHHDSHATSRCVSPIASHPSVTPSDESHAVRAEVARCLRLTLLSENVTNVEVRVGIRGFRKLIRIPVAAFVSVIRYTYRTSFLQFACTSDLKGRVPTLLTRLVAIPKLMNLPYILQEYFAQVDGAQSRCRCGRVGLLPVQMWQGASLVPMQIIEM
jgi:hypothetical protein